MSLRHQETCGVFRQSPVDFLAGSWRTIRKGVWLDLLDLRKEGGEGCASQPGQGQVRAQDSGRTCLLQLGWWEEEPPHAPGGCLSTPRQLVFCTIHGSWGGRRSRSPGLLPSGPRSLCLHFCHMRQSEGC